MKLPDEPGLAEAYADEQLIRDTYWLPGRGDVVIDIGAAVGSYTVPALLRGATVIAVDPDTAATAKLARVAALNNVACEIHSCALFSGGGYPPEMHAALAASAYSYLIPSPGSVWQTLDGLVDDLGLEQLNWVKMDVEGAEYGVLRGGMGVLARFHPQLLIEEHSLVYPYVAQMGSKSKCIDLLHSLAYEVEEIPYGPPPRTYLVAK